MSASVGASAEGWQRAGASVYGSPCEGTSGSTGYRGDNLNEHPWSFAELGNGYALGGLPNHTRIRVRVGKRHTVIVKRDIGGGGGPVDGLPRDFDLYYPVAHWLAGADCNWTGVIEWQRYVEPRAHIRRHRPKRRSASLSYSRVSQTASLIWSRWPRLRVTWSLNAPLME